MFINLLADLPFVTSEGNYLINSETTPYFEVQARPDA